MADWKMPENMLVVSAIAAAAAVFVFIWLYRDSANRGIDTRKSQFVAAFLMVLAMAGAIVLMLPQDSNLLDPAAINLLVMVGLVSAIGSVLVAAYYWTTNRPTKSRVAVCPHCGAEVSRGAATCPSCGRDIKSGEPTRIDRDNKAEQDTATGGNESAAENTSSDPGPSSTPQKEGTVALPPAGQSPLKHLAWFAIQTGNDRGRIHLLGDETRIGRGGGPTCQIVLVDPSVSDDHALVRWQDGSFLLADMASTNGTLVNGETVLRHVLVDKDHVRLGDTEFVFVQAVPMPGTADSASVSDPEQDS